MPKGTDSTWMKGPPSPTDNMMAVFAVLSQNWPTQFKRDVDQSDPAGVWKSNVGYFSQEKLQKGLAALRTLDDKYMPNPPACAKIILKANAYRPAGEAGDEPPMDPIRRSAAVLWVAYCTKMSLQRKQNITTGMATAALGEAKRIMRRYQEAWASEADRSDETFAVLATDMGGQLIPAWNKVCCVGLKIETVADLRAIGGNAT